MIEKDYLHNLELVKIVTFLSYFAFFLKQQKQDMRCIKKGNSQKGY